VKRTYPSGDVLAYRQERRGGDAQRPVGDLGGRAVACHSDYVVVDPHRHDVSEENGGYVVVDAEMMGFADAVHLRYTVAVFYAQHMSVTKENLRKIAVLKSQHRKTDAEVAALFGVTRRTISAWVNSSDYATIIAETRASQVSLARDQIAGLADSVVGTLYTLMTTAKSEMVRYSSAATLGEWLHLAETEVEVKDDDLTEVRRLLAAQQAAQQIRVLPPPRAGGQLPILDAEFTIDDQAPNKKENQGVIRSVEVVRLDENHEG